MRALVRTLIKAVIRPEVESTTEQRTDRNIAYQMALDRVAEQLVQGGHSVCIAESYALGGTVAPSNGLE